MSRAVRVVVGISGASGAAIGLRVLERLAEAKRIETHLVISPAAERTLATEIDPGAPARARALAAQCHDHRDIGASIASGSFRTAGMIVAPCSMRSLSAIAYGQLGDLLTRAADVQLKERRRLVLVARESPLHLGHLRAMAQVTEYGAIIAPPVPAFYLKPTDIAAIVDQIAARAIGLLGLDCGEAAPAEWRGEEA
ncbi:UbiX family flavin prenyltransferase [Bosea sp. (in: a-proteobacteria)]|uniref:UbiX family flavin prenyltransferase n=1 Tax=Bosea sp. (in: a-proteobacteria) TaxID=1871050 RepID=UPI0026145127|nr:UbiX family flavin prenyltransferase [Bosea sp. (in: a-proteobacteria)]MCO5093183.1 UbiX family flavin prenyltransferase [Bosea sp. (in: a-proteobacteria)]